MDKEDLKSILISRNIDLWHMIDTAIDVAASDHSLELRLKRDGFVQKLYAKKLQTFKESKPILGEKLRSSSDYEERKNDIIKNDLIKNVHQAPLESTFSAHIQSCVTSSQLSNPETLGNPSAFLTSIKKNGQNYSISEEQRLENAKKRLRENYQVAENAKEQRRIKTLEIHDLPKAKGSLVVRMKCQRNQTMK